MRDTLRSEASTGCLGAGRSSGTSMPKLDAADLGAPGAVPSMVAPKAPFAAAARLPGLGGAGGADERTTAATAAAGPLIGGGASDPVGGLIACAGWGGATPRAVRCLGAPAALAAP